MANNYQILTSYFEDNGIEKEANVKGLIDQALKANNLALLQGLTIDEMKNAFLGIWNKYGKQVAFDIMDGWESPLVSLFLRDSNQVGEFTELLSIDNDPNKGVKDYELDDGKGNNPFSVVLPIVHSDKYGISEMKVWQITVKAPDMRRAFLTEEGLQNLISQIIGTLRTKANIWLFNYAQSMLTTITKSYLIDPVAIGNDNGNKKAYAEILSLMDKLKNPTTEYNETGFPTVLKPSNAYLILNTDTKASFDVSVLASLFHSEKIGTSTFASVESLEFSNKETANCIGYILHRYKLNLELYLQETASNLNGVNLATNYFYHQWVKSGVNRSLVGIKLITSLGNAEITKGDTTLTAKPLNVINAKIYWTDDGSEPTEKSNEYTTPITFTSGKVYKFNVFSSNGTVKGETQTITIPPATPTAKTVKAK